MPPPPEPTANEGGTATLPPLPTSNPALAVVKAQPAANTALWQGRGNVLAEGTLEGFVLEGGELRLARDEQGRYPAKASATSPPRQADLPFDNAVLSWNASAPAGTSLVFMLRASSAGDWTPWYAMASWSEAGGASKPGQGDQRAKVDVDTLVLKQRADAWQLRVVFETADSARTPALRLLSLAYADLSRPLAGTPPALLPGWARDLPVPAYSQLAEDAAIRNSICSPTSLTMLLNYYGRSNRVAAVAQAVRNRAGDQWAYGNWPLNVAYAATQGLEGAVARFYSMIQLQNEIAQGRPVAISIRFRPGELSNAPIPETGGHLIVVRGFTPAGDAIVNDPFVLDPAAIRRVYNRKELETVWLRSGGIVYLVREG